MKSKDRADSQDSQDISYARQYNDSVHLVDTDDTLDRYSSGSP